MNDDIRQSKSHKQLGTYDPGSLVVRVALPQDAEAVYDLVQDGIAATYPACYEPAMVHAFSSYHTREYVASDIALGKVRVLEADGSILATATLDETYITRVYVATDKRGPHNSVRRDGAALMRTHLLRGAFSCPLRKNASTV